MTDPLRELIDRDRRLRVLLYHRVSTDMQAEKEDGSFDTQRHYMEQMARHEGWEIVGCIEDAETGCHLDRDGIQEARRWAERGDCDVILAYHQDRISRDPEDLRRLARELLEHGVLLRSATGVLEMETTTGRFTGTIMAAVSEMERERTRERIRDAVNRRAKEGKVVGKAQWGYRKDKKTLFRVPDASKAESVRACFRLYLRLKSSTEVARQLREDFPSRKWTASNVTHILRDRTYLGHSQYKIRNDRKQVIDDGEVKSVHPPLVSQEVFDQVQVILDENRRNHRSPNRATKHGIAITGLVKCACGDPMTLKAGHNGKAKGSRPYAYLECKRLRGNSSRGRCDLSTRVSGLALEKALVDIIRQACLDDQIIKLALEELAKLREKQFQNQGRQLSALKKEAKNLRKRIRQLTKVENIEEALQELQDRKEKLEATLAKISDLEAIQPPPLPSGKQIARVRRGLEQFHLLYDQLLPAERQQLFELFFKSITWFGSHVVLVCLGDGAKRVVPYLTEGNLFGTDRFWEKIPEDLPFRGEGPRQSRKGECQVPGCGKGIHAKRRCWTHYVEAKGGYEGHGKRRRVLPSVEEAKPKVEVPKAQPEPEKPKKGRKLTPKAIAKIRRMRAQGKSLRAIGKAVGVSHTAIRMALRADD